MIFDRSWYNRAGVEHVMDFCTKEQHREFLERCPMFENFVVDNGIQLIKYWLEVSMEEQTKRLEDRIDDRRETVTRVLASDPAGEVDEHSPVDVGHARTVGTGDDETRRRHAAAHVARPVGEDPVVGKVLRRPHAREYAHRGRASQRAARSRYRHAMRSNPLRGVL